MRLFYFLIIGLLMACQTENATVDAASEENPAQLVKLSPTPAAENIEAYFTILKGKNVALVVNQTSLVKQIHLADTLLRLGISIKKIFAPEHGFRGTADAGETVSDGIDTQTGLPVISLYGKNKKPSQEQLKDIEIVVFDIQDVGVRFYTYISTMHYVMEACAEEGIKLVVLDRPNPNGFYVDGPVLDTAFRSFVGMHPIPVVHGLTVGELATMINSEGWLKKGAQCNLEVIKCEKYQHKNRYSLPIKPSPNLPNDRAIELYPSLCFFEPTIVSVGRGTDTPFQIIGSPQHKAFYEFQFTPQSTPGANYPKHKGRVCYGKDLSSAPLEYKNSLFLTELIGFYKQTENKANFFTNADFFDLLAGTKQLRQQLTEGKTEEEIRESWILPLEKYNKLRNKYMLYE